MFIEEEKCYIGLARKKKQKEDESKAKEVKAEEGKQEEPAGEQNVQMASEHSD